MTARLTRVRRHRAIVLAGAILCAIGTAAGAPAGTVPLARRSTPAPSTPSSARPWSGADAAPLVTYSGLAAAKQVNQAPGPGRASRDQARSALAASGPRPSSALQHLLDDRQRSSGPGFFTGAFVAWLLMRGGHSGEDRGWLERKLAELRASGLDDDAPARLRPAPARPFRVDGPAEMKAGQPQRVEIHWGGQEAPIRCTVDGHEASGKAPLEIEWTPARAGAFMVECAAGKQRQRAMLHTRSA